MLHFVPSGHEFPFSIQMSHVRLSTAAGGGRDAAAPPADKLKAMQVNKQCQFILKPRPTEMFQQPLVTGDIWTVLNPAFPQLMEEYLCKPFGVVSSDFSQKPFKRRRSLITWAFWRGSSPHLNELSLAGVPRGRLFGQPLSALCVEDALPKPVTVRASLPHAAV